MNCFGHDAATGAAIEVEFDERIVQVKPASVSTDLWVAPGWIDLQVNGLAGVDYNRPDTPLEEIARSIRVLFSTGVTRFYPTVITGAPYDMRAAIENLARAAESLEAIQGFHIEGPHISAQDGPRGAHP